MQVHTTFNKTLGSPYRNTKPAIQGSYETPETECKTAYIYTYAS